MLGIFYMKKTFALKAACQNRFNYWLFAAGTMALVFIGEGCVATSPGPTSCAPPAQPGAQEGVQKDPLSYGAVTSTVKKGETTQEEIVRLFGAPNITTINAGSEEVWVYDRISSTTQQNGWSEARRFGNYFKLDAVAVGGNSGAASGSGKSGSSHESSTRTLTVIINFDATKKVKDYSARATQF